MEVLPFARTSKPKACGVEGVDSSKGTTIPAAGKKKESTGGDGEAGEDLHRCCVGSSSEPGFQNALQLDDSYGIHQR